MADVIYSGSVGGTGMPSSYIGNSPSYSAVSDHSHNGSINGQVRHNDGYSFEPQIGQAYVNDSFHLGSNARDFLDEIYNANRYNKKSYAQANAYNYGIYSDAKSWYERMQNTSIQRMVDDMKRAGINPILAGRYGGYNVAFPTLPYNNNMPYVDVGSYGSAQASMYATDMQRINTLDSLDVSQKNVLKQCETQVYNMLMQTSSARDVASIYTLAQRYVADTTNAMQDKINQDKISGQISIADADRQQRDVENWRNNIDDTINELIRDIPSYHNEFFTPAGVLGFGRSKR